MILSSYGISAILFIMLFVLVVQIFLCRKNAAKYGLILPVIYITGTLLVALFFIIMGYLAPAILTAVLSGLYIFTLFGIRFLYK